MKNRKKYNIIKWIAAALPILAILIFLLFQSGVFVKDPQVEARADNCYARTLKVVTDNDYFPYSFYDEKGNVSGHDVELIALIANELHMNLDLDFMPWDQGIRTVSNGKADVLMTCDYSDTIDSLAGLLKSEVLSEDNFVVFSKSKIKSVNELYGKRIAIMENGNVLSEMEMMNLDENCNLYATNRKALAAVEEGKADCAIMRYTIGTALLKELGYKDINPTISVSQSFMCFGISNNNAELLQEINGAVETLRDNGELDRLHNKWLTTFIHTYSIKEIVEQSPWIVPAFALIIALAVVSYIFSERKRMKADAENNARLFTLEDNFIDLYEVDLQSGGYIWVGKGEPYDNVGGKPYSSVDFFGKASGYIEQVVCEEDRGGVIEALQKENIIKALAKSGHTDHYFRELTEKGIMWLKMRIVYKNEAKKNVLIGVFNAEEEMAARKQAEHIRTEQMAKMTGSLSAYSINTKTGRFRAFKQNEYLAGKYTPDQSFEESFPRYIDTDVAEEDREMVRKAINIPAMLEHLSKEDEYTVTFRDISAGYPRWYEMRAVKLSDEELLFCFSDINEDYVEHVVFDKLEEDFFAFFCADLKTDTAIKIKDDPGLLFVDSVTRSYSDLIGIIASTVEGEPGRTIGNLADRTYINERFAAEDKAEHIYLSEYSGKRKWINLTQLVLERDACGKPAVLAFGFNYLDEEAKNIQEMQIKMAEQKLQLQDALETANEVNLRNEALFSMTNATQWSYEIDASGRVVSARYGERIKTHTNADTEDPMGWANIIHPEDRERVIAEFTASVSDRSGKTPYDTTYRVMMKDGSIHWAKSNGRLIFHSNGTAELFGMSINITEQIEQEREQQKQLAEALSMAESANRAKTTFLNSMSHDIRTPMNAIIGFTGLAENHIDNKEQVQSYLAKIGQSSEHLLSLINDVLDMSRIESGKMNLDEKPENLPEIIHGLHNIILADIHAKHQEFFISTEGINDEDVICDKLRLNQVLLNILSNAIKYTDVGGAISMRIVEKNVKASGYATYEFRIKDNGMGMDKEFMKTIFDPFTRVKSSTVSGIQGTGLGMAITKSIIDMMGGRIEIESEPGKGTEVIIRFDFRRTDAHHDALPVPEAEGQRILVVDDDVDSAGSVHTMLKDAGVRAEWCTSGKECIHKAGYACREDDGYKLFIIDWLMPEMNGVETTKNLRKIVGEDVPIIIITSYDWADIETEAKECGVTAFASKPLFPSDINRLLNKYFGREAQEYVPLEKSVYDFSGKKVLLVEDNELNREIACEILEEEGFVIDTAEDGSIAVEKIKNANAGDYDLILMDIQMPIMDGHEATRQIRALGTEISRIPIIAMTANAFEEDRRAALETGMDEHIAKPIDIGKLKEMLAKFL